MGEGNPLKIRTPCNSCGGIITQYRYSQDRVRFIGRAHRCHRCAFEVYESERDMLEACEAGPGGEFSRNVTSPPYLC